MAAVPDCQPSVLHNADDSYPRAVLALVALNGSVALAARPARVR